MVRPQDLLLDGLLGGLGGAVRYGLRRGSSGLAEDLLQSVTKAANRRLAAHPGLAQGVLHRPEYLAGQASPGIARMQYGNAVERLVGQQIEGTPLNLLFDYIGGPNHPDIVGRGLLSGLSFDITTNTSRSIASHLSRGYGQDLIILPIYGLPYSRCSHDSGLRSSGI